MTSVRRLLVLLACCLAAAPLLSHADDPLVANTPIPLAGTHGKFDFLRVDAARHRLLACHTQNGTLDVIDLPSGKLIKSIATGNSQGVVVDPAKPRYFVSVSQPPQLAIVDAVKLEVIGTVPLPDAADVDAYNATTGRVFVCDDTKPQLWIIDPRSKKIVKTVTLPGAGMEDLTFDATNKHLFQNLKDSSELAQLDAHTGKVLAHWPTLPADKPHGLAIVPGSGDILIAGGNGKLVLVDPATGRILSTVDIPLHVDQIAYDSAPHRVYCASGLGTLFVVLLEHNQLTALASVPSVIGAHSVAVDPASHTVWIAYATGSSPFVQSFTAK